MLRTSVAVLLAGVLMVGCAKPAPTPTPTPGPVTAPTPTPRAATAAPTPVAAVKPSGELRIAIGYLGAEVMDPSLSPASGSKPFLPFYDYLVGATPDGRLARELGLAERWEISHGASSSTYTFYLRQGIKFHNGEEVTAEDVKFSIEHYMRPASVSTGSSNLRAQIERVEAPERYRVVVHTKHPYGLLVYDLSPIGYAEGMVLPRKYIEQVGEETFNKRPIGSGPYRFKEHLVGSYMRFEAVEGEHWLYGVPKYKTLTLFLVPEETTRIAMLKVGQADVIDVSRERAKEVTAAGFKTFLKPDNDVISVMVHNQWQKDTYLYDKRVREALTLALNGEEILKYIFEGQGQLSGDTVYGSWAVGYEPMPLVPYDPARAKALLQDAFPGGVALTIDSFTRPGVPELMRLNEAMAGYWNKVGVKTKIVSQEYATHRTGMGKGTLPNTVAAFTLANRPYWVATWRLILHSEGGLVMTKRADMDALIEALEVESELARFAQRQTQTARFIRENYLWLPLLNSGALYAADPRKVTEWDLGKLQYDWNLPDLFWRR